VAVEITLISHFYNEEFLLLGFCKHWGRLVDHAVMIDYHSTDNSRDVIRSICPTWEIVESRNNSFDAMGCDLECIDYEQRFRGWKFVANSTEILLHWDLRGFLEQWEQEHPDVEAIGMTSAVMCQGPDEPLDYDLDGDLWNQRHWGWIDKGCAARPWRYIHRGIHGQYAQVGRHSTGLSHEHDPSLILQWWGWSPWPQVKQRKFQIQDRIPLSNRLVGWGHQHIVSEEQLEERYQETLRWSSDLMLDPHYRATIEKIREVHNL
jgi:hypothetical protein